jgi:hypothetical protein
MNFQRIKPTAHPMSGCNLTAKLTFDIGLLSNLRPKIMERTHKFDSATIGLPRNGFKFEKDMVNNTQPPPQFENLCNCKL